MIRDTLPARLKEFRKARQLTTRQVGDMIGKSDRTISAWENGRGQPDADNLLALCKIYGISNLSELVGDEVKSVSLSQDEAQLLSYYRELNTQGKQYIMQTIEMAKQVYKKINGNFSNMENDM